MLWPKYEGRRAASEIGSCLINYIKSLPPYIKNVILYSDCCAGQNRNQYIFTALLHVLQEKHISVIEQKFLTSGHTEMEVDNTHSAIESASRHITIYTDHEWINVIKLARENTPYTVTDMEHDAFVDL